MFRTRFVIVRGMKTDVTKLKNSQVEIKVVLESKELEAYREAVTKETLGSVEVDGFRKGKVPKDIAMQQVSSMKLYEEMAHRAISAKYIDIIKDNDIKAIGHPQISITKIAEGSDLEFNIVTAVLPNIKLADYKKIAKEINKEESDAKVSQEEIGLAIMNLRKMRAQKELSEKAAENPEDASEVPSWNDINEEDLPELDDAWTKTVGPFEGLEDFKKKMTENLEAEKKSKAVEKKRIAIIDGIIEKSEIEVPEMMVNHELDKMMNEFEHNISMTGMKFDDYLNSINKTRDDYTKQWQEQAQKRAQTQLMLNNIAVSEKIEPSDEEVQAEVTKIMEQYKDQKGIDENSVLSYVSSVLTHQKVFEFLEGIE